MPQTSFLLDHVEAFAGMLGEANLSAQIDCYPASEVIPAGRAVELVNGAVRLPQSTGQEIAALAGIAIYRDMDVPGGYQVGDMVPVLRKGKVWVDFTGTSAADLEDAKISHSSTVATDRGKFTDATSASTAGSEVTGVVGKFRKGISNTLALVELNLP